MFAIKIDICSKQIAIFEIKIDVFSKQIVPRTKIVPENSFRIRNEYDFYFEYEKLCLKILFLCLVSDFSEMSTKTKTYIDMTKNLVILALVFAPVIMLIFSDNMTLVIIGLIILSLIIFCKDRRVLRFWVRCLHDIENMGK